MVPRHFPLRLLFVGLLPVLGLFPLLGLLPLVGCQVDLVNDGFASDDEDLPVGSASGRPDKSDVPSPRDDGALPLQFSLVDKQSEIRDQGGRNTCSVFAATALMEFFYKNYQGWGNPDFSEQHLQWVLKGESFDEWPDDETSSIFYALSAASSVGIATEEDWAYVPTYPTDPACEGEDKPAVPCFTSGELPENNWERWTLPSKPELENPLNIKGRLFEFDTPVTVGIDWFWQSWSHGGSKLAINTDYRDFGVVPYPSTADQAEAEERPGGHAFIIVGWNDSIEIPVLDESGDLTSEVEKGAYIFKNSWGTAGNWGKNNTHGPGYGFISQRYVHEHGWAFWVAPPQ